MDKLKSFKSWEALPEVWLSKASFMVEISDILGISQRVLYVGDDLDNFISWLICYSGDINFFNGIAFFKVECGKVVRKSFAKLVVERQSSPYSYYFNYKVFTLNEDGSFKDCIFNCTLFQPNVD